MRKEIGDRSLPTIAASGRGGRLGSPVAVRVLCPSQPEFSSHLLPLPLSPISFSLLSLRAYRPSPGLLVCIRNLECSVKSREKPLRGTFTSTTLVFNTLFAPSLALSYYCAANAFHGSDYSLSGLIPLLCANTRILRPTLTYPNSSSHSRNS